MEKNWKIIFIGFIGLVLFFLFLRQIATSSTPENNTNFLKKVDSQGEVIISVKPLDLAIGKKPKFEIQIDTHSVTLSFDITKQAVLKIDEGKFYTDSVWVGTPLGGHHQKGSLTFSDYLTKTKSVTLILKNVGEPPEREFKWNL